MATFDGNGNYRSIGGHGVGNYEFDTPTDVSSSFLLDVYVTDFNNRRIQRFDKNLNYIQTYDETTLSGEIKGFQPRACALSSQGDLFIIDMDGNRILKLDTRGRFAGEFGTYKDGAGMVTEPKDIAVSSSDEIFVLDKSKIIVYDRFGNYLRTISLPATEWKNIHASDQMLVATAPDQIFLRSLADEKQTTLTRSNITGISSNEQFVDAVFMKDKLILLTVTTLYYCSFSK
ncbi:MAG: NHL repeat-containing protein [Bacteroidota bacterium]